MLANRWTAAAVLFALSVSAGAPNLAVAAVTPPGAGDQPVPPAISAVQKYVLEKDYPEVFAGKNYRAKVEGSVIEDLDGDGQSEVIFHFMPHYRQSPTIVIYRITKDLAVTRVTEGLAPGPLHAITDDFLD